MEHSHDANTSRRPSSSSTARTAAIGAAVMLGAIVAFFLLREHWDHLAGRWAYLLLLACPLMHVFMHRGHGHSRPR